VEAIVGEMLAFRARREVGVATEMLLMKAEQV